MQKKLIDRLFTELEATRECLGKIVEHMRWMEGHAKLRIEQTREDKTMNAFSQGRADAIESLMIFARKEAKLDELLKP